MLGRTAVVMALSVGALTASAPAASSSARHRPSTPAVIDPALVLPPPPTPGSHEGRQDLAEVREIMATASAEEKAQAKVDDATEEPSAFDRTLGAGMALRRLPLTWALLSHVAAEADVVATRAKRRFDRTRPWGIDPSIVPCDAAPGKRPLYSYPSGHALFGYSVGLTLAHLLPERAPAILARAQGYAFERVVCRAHFPSDIEASHVLAAIVVTRMEADGTFAARAAAAQRELRAALHKGN